MDNRGLALAARYSYPPNSLSLCGPARQNNLAWYTASQQPDLGTKEILEQFSTLYPYLCFIAGENHLKDPFDLRVIEAYWLGNALINETVRSDFLHFLDDDLPLSKKLLKKESDILKQKVATGGLPHHAFHVLNVYRRTGHQDIPHTVETMDACLINWGKVTKFAGGKVIVETKPLRTIDGKLQFGDGMHRALRMQGETDVLLKTLNVGDWVSYHWGYVCQKLNTTKLRNLKMYTLHALRFANRHI